MSGRPHHSKVGPRHSCRRGGVLSRPRECTFQKARYLCAQIFSQVRLTKSGSWSVGRADNNRASRRRAGRGSFSRPPAAQVIVGFDGVPANCLAIISSPSRKGELLLLADFKLSITSWRSRLGSAPPQKGRKTFQLEGVPSELFHAQAHLAQCRHILSIHSASRGAELDHVRKKQPLLDGTPLFLPCGAQLLEEDPLMAAC